MEVSSLSGPLYRPGSFREKIPGMQHKCHPRSPRQPLEHLLSQVAAPSKQSEVSQNHGPPELCDEPLAKGLCGPSSACGSGLSSGRQLTKTLEACLYVGSV